MIVLVLGSAGTVPSPGRACSSILLDGRILIDCGTGSLMNMVSAGVEFEKIETILLTHLHCDHVSDIVPLLWTMRMKGRRRPLRVYGPPGTKSSLMDFMALLNTPEGFIDYELLVEDLVGGVSLGEFSTCWADHTIPALAYRVSIGGKSVCVTGDTRPCERIIELARGVDLLVHDSSFTREHIDLAWKTGHSTAYQAGDVAENCGARILLLTHLYSSDPGKLVEEASRSYGGRIIISEDLLKIEL